MPHLAELWQIHFLWNTVAAWSIALAIFLATLTLLPLFKSYISAKRRKWLQSGRELPAAIEITTLLIDRTSPLFTWTVALYLASSELMFPVHVERFIAGAIVLT